MLPKIERLEKSHVRVKQHIWVYLNKEKNVPSQLCSHHLYEGPVSYICDMLLGLHQLLLLSVCLSFYEPKQQL